MKKNIRLTESDLYRIVRKVIKEQQTDTCIRPTTPKTLIAAHKVMKEMGFRCTKSSGGPGSEEYNDFMLAPDGSEGPSYKITYSKVISNGTLSLTVTDSKKVAMISMISYQSDKINIKKNQPFKFNGNKIKLIESGIERLYLGLE